MAVITPETFISFGDLLTYLRKRAFLTQDELSRAVGYSRAHVTLPRKESTPARSRYHRRLIYSSA